MPQDAWALGLVLWGMLSRDADAGPFPAAAGEPQRAADDGCAPPLHAMVSMKSARRVKCVPVHVGVDPCIGLCWGGVRVHVTSKLCMCICL